MLVLPAFQIVCNVLGIINVLRAKEDLLSPQRVINAFRINATKGNTLIPLRDLARIVQPGVSLAFQIRIARAVLLLIF